MGAGKNPYLRYRIIHSCFSSKSQHYWSIAQLIEKLAAHDLVVEKRSVEHDLEMMRHDSLLGFFAPIAYSRKEKGYHYTNEAFKIDHLPLTADDLRALAAATNILQQYRELPLVKQVEGVVDKLTNVVTQLSNQHSQHVMAFEPMPFYKGRQFIEEILKAIADKKPLCVTYHKFADTKSDEHLFHPYFLKEYLGRWYVLGFSEARKNIITLGLDRIEKMQAASVAFRENTTLQPQEYFQHTLGITVGKGPVEEIELWFSTSQAPYIKTQHLHHTQKTVSEDATGLIITVQLIPNPELTQLLLRYGAEVKVLKPKTLQQAIVQVFKKSLRVNAKT